MRLADFSAPKRLRDPAGGELAAVGRMVFGRSRLLWAGVAAVLIPLTVLLVLQYGWLSDLQHNSTIARRAALDNYLKAISNETYFFFSSTADRVLNLPQTAYTEESIQEAARLFKSRDLAGVRTTFIVTYQPIPKLFTFDRSLGIMVEAVDPSPETQAVWVAVAPWSALHKTLGEVRRTGFFVDEHDPAQRIILNPIIDEHNFLLAITGLIVDQEYFLERVLPRAIDQALPKFDDRDALWVCVHDRRGHRVFPAEPCAVVEPNRVERAFDFMFSDWSLSLQGELAVPERWARANFAVNVTLSAALAVILVGGITLTVRTALREMKLSAMKNEFVSNVSHELRTPLASIRVFGELMRNGRVGEAAKVAEYGAHIEAESQRLTQLINNILDFSHIESGHKIYSFETTDIERLVADSVRTHRARARERGLVLEYQGSSAPIPGLQLDANAIDRAVANLLDNAIKYSKEAGRIIVSLRRDEREVSISVADQGIGIPPDELDRIFDRFHRVSTGLVHDVRGTGLGLSLVQHIVRAHGGHVTVESELDRGSIFTIRLPIGWRPGGNERGAPCHGS